MRAITYHSPTEALTLQELPTPEPGPGQMLLKVQACGICGSDLHAYQAGLVDQGNVFGHEFAGEVVAIGTAVAGDWQIGDRANSVGAITCGHCNSCLRGDLEHCQSIELIGFSRMGAYAEYVVVQATGCTRLPDTMDDQQAALVEPLAVGLAAFRDCQLPLGGNILVIGAGIIGMTVIKWARFFGAEHAVIADLDDERLNRATLAGASATINASSQADPVQGFRDATGVEPDVIVECVGRPLLQSLIEAAPAGAHIVSVGAAMEAEHIVSWVAAEKKIRMTFSFGYSVEDFGFITRMIAAGRMNTDELVTRSISLEQVPMVFAELLRPNQQCKVMIEPNTEG